MTPSHRLLAIVALGSLLACSGRTARLTPAPATPEATVGQFLAAVNATDLDRMADLFGDERGKVAWGSATERQQRLAIMQRLLAADSSRLLGTEPDSAGVVTRRVVHVEMMRGERHVRVPFIVARQKTGGWLVYAIDLSPLMPAPARRNP